MNDDHKGLPEELTAEQIIEMLQSEDSKQKTRAMDELFPGESTVLVRIEASGNMHMATTEAVDRHRVFSGLQWATCFVGNLLGMGLNWGPKQQEKDKLVVAVPGGTTPMMR